MAQELGADKLARFQAALDRLIERVSQDRYVLAIVVVGSLSEETIWRRESIALWIIEADGVSRRLPFLNDAGPLTKSPWSFAVPVTTTSLRWRSSASKTRG